MEKDNNGGRIPTDLQVDLLMSDWLGGSRERETAVHRGMKGIDGNYDRDCLSGYFLGDDEVLRQDTVTNLVKARSIAQTVVDSFATRPVRVTVGGGDSMTDGSTINVATSHFDDGSLTTADKIDLTTGFAVHEACHINHTDFGDGARTNEPEQLQRLRHDLDNILEDERIEHLLSEPKAQGGDACPGFVDFLAKCKDYVFRTKYEPMDPEDAAAHPVAEFLNLILLAVRFPASLDRDAVIRHYDRLDRVRRVLFPFPKTHDEIKTAVDEIICIVREMMKKQMTEERQQKNQDSGNSQGQNGQDGNPHGQDGQQPQGGQKLGGQDDGPQSQNGGQPQAGQGQGQQGQGQQAGGGTGGTAPTAKEVDAALVKELFGDACDKVLEKMEKILAASKAKGSGRGDRNDCSKLYDETVRELVNGRCEIDRSQYGEYIIRRQKGDKNKYSEALASVRRYIPSMSKILRCHVKARDWELYGEKSGRFDHNKLVSLKCGNRNVFRKQGTRTSDGLSICVLIDESGSMDGSCEKAARAAAVLLDESVRGLDNLECWIYGFSSGVFNVYREPDYTNRMSLGGTDSISGTPTHAAMAIAMRRIRRKTRNKCLFVVVTDGAPDNSTETVRMAEEMTKNDFVVVGVGINGAQRVKSIFPESVVINDMSQLAPQLNRIIRKKIFKTLNTYDICA